MAKDQGDQSRKRSLRSASNKRKKRKYNQNNSIIGPVIASINEGERSNARQHAVEAQHAAETSVVVSTNLHDKSSMYTKQSVDTYNAQSALNFHALVSFIKKRAQAFCDEDKFDSTQLLNSGEISYIIRKFINNVSIGALKNCADAIISFINPNTNQTLLHYFLEQICLSSKQEETVCFFHVVNFLYHIKLQSKTTLITNTDEIYKCVQSRYKESTIFSDLMNLMTKYRNLFESSEVQKRILFLSFCMNNQYNKASLMMPGNKTSIHYIQDEDGLTPLYYAIKAGKYAFAELLLRNGAPIHLLNYCNRNIFHMVHRFNFDVCMRSLYAFCNTKELVNEEDSLQITPLRYACRVSNIPFAYYLIEKQASVQFHGLLKSNALLEACRFNNEKLCTLLLSSHPHLLNSVGCNGCSPLHQAVLINNEVLMDLFIKKGADCYVINNLGQNILHIACNAQKTNMVKIFFRTYREIFNVTMSAFDNQGLTPIHYLVEKCSLDLIFYLLHQGMSIDILDRSQSTPIHYLIYKQLYPKAIMILRQCKEQKIKINLDITDNNGMTPLNLAAHYGNFELVNLLIVMGANIYIPNKLGNTPLQTAQIQRNKADMLNHNNQYQEIINIMSEPIIEDGQEAEAEYRDRVDINEDARHLVTQVGPDKNFAFLDLDSNFELDDKVESMLLNTSQLSFPCFNMKQESEDLSTRSI